MGGALPTEVPSGDREYTRYCNRKYFIEQLLIGKPKGRRGLRRYCGEGEATAESSHLGLRERREEGTMIKGKKLKGGAQGGRTQTSKEAMPAGKGWCL